jgi:hypothetical protein
MDYNKRGYMKNLIITGAGVDKALGLPLANGLVSELANFTENEGMEIHNVLKKKLPNLRFSFNKFVENAVEIFLENQLSNPSLLTNELEQIKEIHSNVKSEYLEILIEITKRLEIIKEANTLPEDIQNKLEQIIRQEENIPIDADSSLMNIRGLSLSNAPKKVIDIILKKSIRQPDTISEPDRDLYNYLTNRIFNFEKLLVDEFIGFYINDQSRIKKYIYISWILWAYLRYKSFHTNILTKVNTSFYGTIKKANNGNFDFITFNYTNFWKETGVEPIYFHGSCDSYMRFDTREFFEKDDRINNAKDVTTIKSLIESIEFDFSKKIFFLPSIIPPLVFKPILSVEYLEKWYQSTQLIENAKIILIIGYSFNFADEHFNDVIRKKTPGKKIIIVNPDIDSIKTQFCKIKKLSEDSFSKSKQQGFDCYQSDNHVFVKGKAEEFTYEKIQGFLD